MRDEDIVEDKHEASLTKNTHIRTPIKNHILTLILQNKKIWHIISLLWFQNLRIICTSLKIFLQKSWSLNKKIAT